MDVQWTYIKITVQFSLIAWVEKNAHKCGCKGNYFSILSLIYIVRIKIENVGALRNHLSKVNLQHTNSMQHVYCIYSLMFNINSIYFDSLRAVSSDAKVGSRHYKQKIETPIGKMPKNVTNIFKTVFACRSRNIIQRIDIGDERNDIGIDIGNERNYIEINNKRINFRIEWFK